MSGDQARTPLEPKQLEEQALPPAAMAMMVEGLHLQPGDLVVVRVGDAVTADFAERVSRGLADVFEPRGHEVLVLNQDVKIEALHEDDMRRLGWVRAPAHNAPCSCHPHA